MNNTGFEIVERGVLYHEYKKATLLLHNSVVVLIPFFEDVIAKIPSCYYQICILTYTHKSAIILK